MNAEQPIKLQAFYKEKYRPQYHFSARRGWHNDPNGMYYQDGKFHLFFQHNPYGAHWGNMTWGHAVSKDMVHWEEVAGAVHPDGFGTIFSGSAAVDVNNTTGLMGERVGGVWQAGSEGFRRTAPMELMERLPKETTINEMLRIAVVFDGPNVVWT